jgi:ribosomal protein S18 acetylase RimI-like enzyme
MAETELIWRQLGVEDRDHIEKLHLECFPVHYTPKFYDQAVLGYHTQRGVEHELFSLLAVRDDGRATGLEDGEVKGGDGDDEEVKGGDGDDGEVKGVDGDDGEGGESKEGDSLPQHLIAGAIISQFQRASTYTEYNLLDDTARYPLVAYIMTLASTSAYRRRGIASRLLSSCIDHAVSNRRCGAIYLHVITYNEAAIAFYSKNGFARVGTLLNYYLIDGR